MVKLCVPPDEEVKVFEAGVTLRFGSGDTVIVPAALTVATVLALLRPFLRMEVNPLPVVMEPAAQVTVAGGTEVPPEELQGSRLSLVLCPLRMADETTLEFSLTVALLMLGRG